MDDMREQHEAEILKKRYVIIGALLLLLAVVLITAYGMFSFYYHKMNIQPANPNYEIDLEALEQEDDDMNADLEDSPKESIRTYETYLDENAVLQEEAEELPYDSGNVYHLLLVGMDARHTNQNSRSDTMMILSINRNTKKIIMTSVMRDIYCTIPGVGHTRLNHAYAYGGAALLLETIEYNFGIHIDDYVTINFYGFMDAIDAIGGVKIEVSADEIRTMNFYIKELNSLLGLEDAADQMSESDAGTCLLNGKQALAYSRVRDVGSGDFERTGRQRTVLTAVQEKARMLSLPELNDLMDLVLPCVTTNLTQGKVLTLMLHASEYLDYEVNSGRIPFDGSWQNLKVRGMDVLEIDFHENKEYWLEQVYGE